MIHTQKLLRPNVKLALICATPLTFNIFMRDHIVAISNEYRLTLVCNGSASDLKLESNCGIYFENIPIQRKVSLFFDPGVAQRSNVSLALCASGVPGVPLIISSIVLTS